MSGRSASYTERPLPGSDSSSPGRAASSPARPGPKPISPRRSPTPPGTSGHSSARSASPRLRRMVRRRRQINDAKPVLTEAQGTFRRLGARSWAQRTEAELRASGVAVAAPPGATDALSELTPTAPDRPPGQRRPDQPPDQRPALPVTAHGQLAPLPVLPQARDSRPQPATRRDRPRQHANTSTQKRRKPHPSLSRSPRRNKHARPRRITDHVIATLEFSGKRRHRITDVL